MNLDLDDDGYPTEESLRQIAQAPIRSRKDCAALLGHVRSIWQWGPTQVTEENGMFRLSTGGWSGNEDIVAALQDNTMFWALCWESSRRGGHHVFRVGVMADRTSATVFAMVFEHLSVVADERDKKLARMLWDEMGQYDFSYYQLGCDEALERLGLAKRVVDEDGFDNWEYGPQ